MICENITITIPKSRYANFRHTNPNLRWGQQFHQYMNLDKITSKPNKVWCDRLYNADKETAKAMVLSVLDHSN